MRTRDPRVLGPLALALTLIAGLAPVAPASAATSLEPDAVCAKNLNPPNGDAVIIDDFPGGDDFDTFGGADFRLRKACNVDEVRIIGHSEGQSAQATIWIYKNTADDLPPNDGPATCSAVEQSTGPSFTVPVDHCRLKKGRYWLVVQVTPTAGGPLWSWQTTDVRTGLEDAYRNPGDGFETGCTQWRRLSSCVGRPYEYLFSIK